jgi:hypothetical protein
MLRKTSAPGEVGTRLEGPLLRDSTSTFTAAEQPTPATLDETFPMLAERSATAWPDDDGGQGTAALNYVAQNIALGKQTCPANFGPVRNTYCVATGGRHHLVGRPRGGVAGARAAVSRGGQHGHVERCQDGAPARMGSP